MIPGLETALIDQPDQSFIEIAVTSESVHFTILLLIGPADPSILSERLPLEVFERGQPIHVGALDLLMDVGETIVDILELMNPDEIAVFLCQDEAALQAACDVLEI